MGPETKTMASRNSSDFAISLSKFSSNTNPKWLIIIAFLNFSGVVWAAPYIEKIAQLLRGEEFGPSYYTDEINPSYYSARFLVRFVIER